MTRRERTHAAQSAKRSNPKRTGSLSAKPSFHLGGVLAGIPI
jgi:hypothetical protein